MNQATEKAASAKADQAIARALQAMIGKRWPKCGNDVLVRKLRKAGITSGAGVKGLVALALFNYLGLPAIDQRQIAGRFCQAAMDEHAFQQAMASLGFDEKDE
jgi:hypothetical protein